MTDKPKQDKSELESAVGSGVRIAMRAKDSQFKKREAWADGDKNWWEENSIHSGATSKVSKKDVMAASIKESLRKTPRVIRKPWYTRLYEWARVKYYRAFPDKYPPNRVKIWMDRQKMSNALCKVCTKPFIAHRALMIDDIYPALFLQFRKERRDDAMLDVPEFCWVYPEIPEKYKKAEWFGDYVWRAKRVGVIVE